MATSRTAIDAFVSGKTLALVGVSANGKGFGNGAYKELKARGYRVLPVHPTASTIQGDPCWPSLAQLPERVERLLVVVPPAAVESVVRDAAAAGIRHVWLQQGASSAEAVKTCEEHGLQVVNNECILMYAGPAKGIHGLHRWLWKVLGKIPN